MRSKSEALANSQTSYTKKTRTSINSGSTWSAWTSTEYTPTWDTGTRTTQSENTPNYRQMLKKGLLLPHTRFIQTESRMTHNASSMSSIFKTSSTGRLQTAYEGDFRFGPILSSLTPVPTVNIVDYVPMDMALVALQKAAADCSTGGIDGLTFIAELAKARQMLLQAVVRVHKIVTSRTFADSFDDAVMAIPGLWLEARFGWRPLLGDLVDICEQLSRVDRLETKIVSKSTTIPLSTTIPDYEHEKSDASTKAILKVSYDLEVSARGSCAALLRNAGFGFNPVATAWELVPFSFIIDWFLGVGNAILSAQTVFLSREYTGSIGYHLTLTENIEQTVSAVAGGSYISLSGSTSATRFSSLTTREPRSVNYAPRLQANVDAFKGIDSLALLISQILARLR